MKKTFISFCVFLGCAICMCQLFNQCEKDELITKGSTLPTVYTSSVSGCTQTTAVCGGGVTECGKSIVSAKGVCWSTSKNPTIDDSHTSDGQGIGKFSSQITDLTAGTTYYVRAYATNSVGTAYGEQKSFNTNTAVTLPTVTTSSVANVTANSAACGGTVTSNGGTTVTARGVCWSTSPNPTINNSHTTNGGGNGNFSSSITGLSAGTTYYVRAYATNSVGTAYGAQKSFTTTAPSFNCGTSTISDVDGNTYNTVKIGNQCWMKQNLRTTKYADNTPIALGSTTSTTIAYRYCPNNSSSNVATYGYLYNWKAVMRNSSSSSNNPSHVQGICPDGWHVPSDAEWTQLTNYVSNHSTYCCSGNTDYIAKALASTTGWNSSSNTSCDVGNTPSSNNATGFSALPAGGYDSSYSVFGYAAYFWSATEFGSVIAYCGLYYNDAGVDRNPYDKSFGLSVRCVRD